MDFIPSVDSYPDDVAAQQLWNAISGFLDNADGIGYYRHPVITVDSAISPDIAVLAAGYQPHLFLCLNYRLEEIEQVDVDAWIINGKVRDSPLLVLQDLCVSLNSKFTKARRLRGKLTTQGSLHFPLTQKSLLLQKFPLLSEYLDDNISIYAQDNAQENPINPLPGRLTDTEWLLAQSVFQGIHGLNKQAGEVSNSAETMGEAIRILEKQIAILDKDQHRVSVQMAPGPQRIRGLAGTGKTVVLAMKAANIHRRYPDKNILFTFNTQSLYNQARRLISRFFNEFNDEFSEPNWDKLHIRHAWGARSRPGVYADACKRQGRLPLTFMSAKASNPEDPFAAACRHALSAEIEPYYDYILVDEAQDFPPDFFGVLARLIEQEQRKIYFAYDELQSLSALQIPSAAQLFGNDSAGKPFIDLDGEYPGGIEKDFVLHKSYRCPVDVLLLAHGVGLGVHAPRGCVQMLFSEQSWNAVGYEVEKGDFTPNAEQVLLRPQENSPNPIRRLYTGTKPSIAFEAFEERNLELEWVANAIVEAIKIEGVPPEQIVVIALDSQRARSYFTVLQRLLYTHGIKSLVPGLMDESWEFSEVGHVTLSTVYRAKGNEAALVFIITAEVLYSYAEELESRNRAFASISRTKAWLRITGIGQQMERVIVELNKVLQDVPRLRFKCPHPNSVRKLDASETTRRRKEVESSKKSMQKLLNLDVEALRQNPTLVQELLEKLKEAGNEH